MNRYEEIAERVLSEVHGIEPCDLCGGSGGDVANLAYCHACKGTGVAGEQSSPEPAPDSDCHACGGEGCRYCDARLGALPEPVVTNIPDGWETRLQ